MLYSFHIFAALLAIFFSISCFGCQIELLLILMHLSFVCIKRNVDHLIEEICLLVFGYCVVKCSSGSYTSF